MPGMEDRVWVGLVVSLVVAAVAGGCAAIREVTGFRDQLAQAQSKVRIAGTVETEGDAAGTLVVLLARRVEDGDAALVGVDSYVRRTPGTFLFVVPPGRYQLGAYEDRNGNGLLDPDERVARVIDSPVHELGPGASARVELLLKEGSALGDRIERPVDLLSLVERTDSEQREFSLWAFSRRGEVVGDLDDERFGAEAGRRGLWRPMDFLNEELAGIYFLEPYDEDRIPVLFVHGIAGHPQEFQGLIAALDRDRFQPWFYFYPSGLGLDSISEHLARLLERVQIETDFDEIAIVAHSMGGLVSRSAIYEYAADTERDEVRLFVSISTPWGGDLRARRTEGARIALPESFRDMSPSSSFLRRLFYEDEERQRLRALPRRVDYHLIFGFSGRGTPCNDGSVSCTSQALEEAQEQALSVRAWNYGHVEILHSQQAARRVKLLLEGRF